ncbi:MAG: translation elongation factor G [Candidatus Doudnabacteria bacterium RIFCSPHIGHO2_02_FULL_48_21]|uniref:Elongation factor G n=1 Tax=Candidatus Doudnabacteria bacterium RIFCSPLOWO2_02_FULL_48_13 TaxID=1817845 RepID=A0A1F5Q9S5_9BACT|nr:MAG: translation elongation factor G [Candidatus Doudnabacteria bacterium RIFCSPHIGHO2_01_48_18]OGE79365.1 MAG: translation elongation factor G [Candidatus Doudnabacteria bacterium RIFCSPHIGHO2_01_FULL_48_180]OGE91349.1 MAG: translation elongation factor G [Candidatus Doudnabacteria bacterium RIFCSPHIGHO2_12_FULL_47_25]OGE92894.1 MAG: translation elongation factor G [Candidatus Doudnabacteria bacterium RIFCSPHIGHO2_02_FULL_48_21]OGE96683.1 MAG: translation elongation factor G [Candidatus Dou
MPRETPIEQTRNIGIIAHIDAGKTTVTEGILYNTGLKHTIGAVHEGETTTDWMEQERERGITITAAAVTCYWTPKYNKLVGDVKHKINIIDTPGHVDFTVEVERSLRVLDGAVVVFDGKMGVEPQSETVWRQADKYHVPRMCFINKINQTGGDFYKSLDSIHKRLSEDAFPIQIPIGFEKEVSGYIDLVQMKGYVYKDYTDKDLTQIDIPADLKTKAEEYRHSLLEKVVESDDALMEKYLAGGDVTETEFLSAIRKATQGGKFFPVLGGDGRGIIVQTILDAVTNFLPNPNDKGSVRGIDPNTQNEIERKPEDSEPFSALAFKIATDPFVGKLAFFRVYSGTLAAGSYVLNARSGNKERVGRIVRMHANSREEIKEVFAGDIAALVGPKATFTGDTLCSDDKPIVLESITFPEPVISQAIEPKTKADQEKMGIALQKLGEEDPTFHIKSNEETGQTIIEGMGELHLEIIVDRMKREFKVEANVGAPQVAYKETFKKTVEVEGKYIRQTGGRGQYGHVWLRLEPQEPGKGREFVDEIVGGVIPKEYIPAVGKGVMEAADNGVIAGFPVVDFKAALYDGSFHEVDSSEIAFKIAGSKAFQDGMRRAEPVILEPIMRVEVITPEEFMGDVMGDISAKRGEIKEMGDRGKNKVITATVPLGSMFGYATTIRSMSQGQASYTMEFSHYSEVPKNVAEKIIGEGAKIRVGQVGG